MDYMLIHPRIYSENNITEVNTHFIAAFHFLIVKAEILKGKQKHTDYTFQRNTYLFSIEENS